MKDDSSSKSRTYAPLIYVEVFVVTVCTSICSIVASATFPSAPNVSTTVGSGLGGVIGLGLYRILLNNQRGVISRLQALGRIFLSLAQVVVIFGTLIYVGWVYRMEWLWFGGWFLALMVGSQLLPYAYEEFDTAFLEPSRRRRRERQEARLIEIRAAAEERKKFLATMTFDEQWEYWEQNRNNEG
ncbi:MAG: hypothetical protein WAU70_04880 [Flavobacteriales bacterium]